jgi:TPR repeat protein
VVHYYKLVADQNHMKALYLYGECLEYGKGVPVDLNEAAECYRRSAMQSYSELNSFAVVVMKRAKELC